MEIRKFVCDQLRDCLDLSKLTLNVLKGRYLEHVGQESLSPEDRLLMKKVVKEELMKMQEDQGDDESVSDMKKPHHNKRKRKEESMEETELKKADAGSRAKRSRLHSSAESMDSGIDRVGTEQGQIQDEKDDEKSEENAVPNNVSKKMKNKRKGTRNRRNEVESSDSEVEVKRRIKRDSLLKGPGEVERQREDMGCEENNGNEGHVSDDKSSGEGEDIEGKVLKETSHKSDSSSLPSLDDEPEKKSEPQPAKKKKKTVKKSNTKGASVNTGHVSDDESSGEGEDMKGKVLKKTSHKSDSDSSSLPSLDDEREKKSEPQQAKKKKKTVKKSNSTKGASVNTGHVSDDVSSGEGEDVKGKVLKETSHKSDSDSSLPSLDDESEKKSGPQQAKKKKKTVKKSNSTKGASVNTGHVSDDESSGEGEDVKGKVLKETSHKSDSDSSLPSLDDESEKKSEPQPAKKKKKTVKNSNTEGASGNTGHVSDDESSGEGEDIKGKVLKETSHKSDSDSSSVPSLDDEPEKKSGPQQAKKKKTTVKKSNSTKGASVNTGHVSDVSSGEGEDVKGKVLKETSHKSDSDSSLPSLDDESEKKSEPQQAKKKSKTVKKSNSTEGASEGAREEKDENKTVTRLKRYIALCGVRKNYKKLFDGCRSIRSKVAVLKKELEELGVQGQPSIEKCKKARLKREETQELAGLDVSNIITTHGRPKRNAPSALRQTSTPSASYKRAVNSSSDSDDDSHADRGRKRVTDWGNLQGIISDDGGSD